jgi:hypothetical protein
MAFGGVVLYTHLKQGIDNEWAARAKATAAPVANKDSATTSETQGQLFLPSISILSSLFFFLTLLVSCFAADPERAQKPENPSRA